MEKLFLDIVAALAILGGGFLAILFFSMGCIITKMDAGTFEKMKESCKSDRAWKSFWSNYEAERRWRKRWKQ